MTIKDGVCYESINAHGWFCFPWLSLNHHFALQPVCNLLFQAKENQITYWFLSFSIFSVHEWLLAKPAIKIAVDFRLFKDDRIFGSTHQMDDLQQHRPRKERKNTKLPSMYFVQAQCGVFVILCYISLSLLFWKIICGCF